MKTLPLALVMAAALPLCASAQIVTTLLNDNFNDNDRGNQSLPGSAQWFGGLAGVLTVTGGPTDYKLQNAPTTTTLRHAVAYFTPSGAPSTLSAVGEKISLSFDITPTTASPAGSNVFRLALVNSGSARLSTDGNPNLSLQSGYGFFVNPGTQVGNLYYRTTDSGPILSSLTAGSGWASAGTGITPQAADQFGFAQNITYSILFTIERESSGLKFSYSASGNGDSFSGSVSYSTVATYSFDTVALGWSNAFGTGLIDNVVVTHVSAVPEPSSYAILAGLGAIACAVSARRRRA